MTDLDAAIACSGLCEPGARIVSTPLAGGVSSDIWRLDIEDARGRRSLCVKRALTRLKVAADWSAPVSRNGFEWAWMQFASGVVPQAVPRPLARSAEAGWFAMEFLSPQDHPVWKQQLLAGTVEPTTAAAVGRVLAKLHSASANDAALAREFASDDNFLALRLEPYLLFTAERHPALAPCLQILADRTAGTRVALVHGDVSPKNILVGPNGPVILDAECAWFGDPAFDIAFCLNHLLLKALVRPDCVQALDASFAAFTASYFESATAEPRGPLEARAASLLPALLLARVDGKSPVEYLGSERQRSLVRDCATQWLRQDPASLEEVAAAWFARVGSAVLS